MITTLEQEAAAILGEAGDERRWPKSREARAVIRQAREYLVAELDVYQRLLADEMDWSEFDPDLEVFEDTSADKQRTAIEIAGGRAYDAALALEKRLAEYRAREKQATERAREWFAS